MQTILATLQRPQNIPLPTRQTIDCGDDQIALFCNEPEQMDDLEQSNGREIRPSENHSSNNQSAAKIGPTDLQASTTSPANERGRPAAGNVLLIHGISGCHAAPYMIANAVELLRRGFRTFRMDNRGCGSLRETATTITNAARSADVAAAIAQIAKNFDGPIHAIGVSLGGNQLLRLAGRIGSGVDAPPAGWDRIGSIAAVAPPIDLPLCSANMDRLRNRIYNRYFIRALIRRIPPAVAASSVVRMALTGPSMRKLRQLDDRITAPLGGYGDAMEYYHDASAIRWIDHIRVATQIIAAADDPIVPPSTFESASVANNSVINRLLTRRGGHVGYIGPRRSGWLAQRLADWTQLHGVSH